MKDVRGQRHSRQHAGFVTMCVFVCTWVCEKEKRCERRTSSDFISQHEPARTGVWKSHGECQEPIKWRKSMEVTQMNQKLPQSPWEKQNHPYVFSILYFRKVLETYLKCICLPTQLLLCYGYIHATPSVILTTTSFLRTAPVFSHLLSLSLSKY